MRQWLRRHYRPIIGVLAWLGALSPTIQTSWASVESYFLELFFQPSSISIESSLQIGLLVVGLILILSDKSVRKPFQIVYPKRVTQQSELTEEERREQAILQHPEFIDDLQRLNERIWNLLYVRYADRPCLIVYGEKILGELDAPATVAEFDDCIKIISPNYKELYEQIKRRDKGYGWKTFEFVERMRSISTHLASVDIILELFYRAVRTRTKDRPVANWVRTHWERFRTEYNALLQEWKNFTDRFDRAIGYGTTTTAKLADPWPEL